MLRVVVSELGVPLGVTDRLVLRLAVELTVVVGVQLTPDGSPRNFNPLTNGMLVNTV